MAVLRISSSPVPSTLRCRRGGLHSRSVSRYISLLANIYVSLLWQMSADINRSNFSGTEGWPGIELLASQGGSFHSARAVLVCPKTNFQKNQSEK